MARRTLPDLVCLYCKQVMPDKNRRNTYCGSVCQHKYIHESYIERWKLGEEVGYGGANNQLSAHIKKYLIERRGCSCWKCGWAEVHPTTKKVPLQWNHIDGDSTNCRESNLELICPNCHSLTPNFGALNKGKSTRTNRRTGSLVDRHVANVN